jgi:hypothetical protein
MFGLFARTKADEGSRRESVPQNWRSTLIRADTSHLDAVLALNVRLLCEHATLVKDRTRALAICREALDRALKIQNKECRSFAIRRIEAIAERSEENGKTRLITPDARRPSHCREGLHKTRFI